jgi:hypothetical protein
VQGAGPIRAPAANGSCDTEFASRAATSRGLQAHTSRHGSTTNRCNDGEGATCGRKMAPYSASVNPSSRVNHKLTCGKDNAPI